MSIEVDEYYQKQSKELTDMLFDKGFLADDLTRESIVWLEDYLGFVLQCKVDMAVKCALLTKSLKSNVAAKEAK